MFFRHISFPFFKQHDAMDCGPSCLKMITSYYGKPFSIDYLREISYITKEGVSLLSISEAAEKVGFKTLMLKLNFDKLMDCPFPCVLHWNQNHYVVLVDIKKKNIFNKLISNNKNNWIVTIADPNTGVISLSEEEFLTSWSSSDESKGVCLLLEPTQDFFNQKNNLDKDASIKNIFNYFKPHKKLVFQLFLGLIILSISSLAFPFLTKYLIDIGVTFKSFELITLILFSQLFLFLGITIITVVRSWISLHVSAKISLNIISDFLVKLLNLPIKFFDSKSVGDLSQRINDHHRVESFLTNTTVDSIFSFFSILIFTIVLAVFDLRILSVFIFSSLLGILWILFFQKKRKQLDYVRFQRNKESQDKMYEFIVGMSEIKLNGSETYRRWEWERLQIKLFKLNIKSLTLEQYQKIGFIFFTNIKNIFISFLSAKLTIDGEMSLGTMLSISFIIGQTNGPLEQIIEFFRASQDAKISMDRLGEVQNKVSEDDLILSHNETEKIDNKQEISIKNLSFQYEGPSSPFVLRNVNISIPKGKVTAIVGASGSGKTTLLKMLLGFYFPVTGGIYIDGKNLNTFAPKMWRLKCGTVLQDGYIFSDTIMKNVAADGKEVDANRYSQAISISNLTEFISSLPLKHSTKIGSSGMGLSGGQEQRILLARAVYKNPDYLFLDEATSSLDASNERAIINNLKDFFKGRTVVVIAHRLSTVKDADQILVLDKGEIVESGTHITLVEKGGKYLSLIKNQLEL